jgi:hypothetical protein
MHALEELNWQKIGLRVTEQSSVLSNGIREFTPPTGYSSSPYGEFD